MTQQAAPVIGLRRVRQHRGAERFLSLPGSAQVESACEALAAAERRPATIVDLSTTAEAVTRSVASRRAERDIALADPPVPRTVESARRAS